VVLTSPLDATKAQALGIWDFFTILLGALVGQGIGAVDTLGPVNIAIGLPVGVVGSLDFIKYGWLKEILMGLGLGLTLQGLSDIYSFVSNSIDQKASEKGKETIRSKVMNAISDWLSKKGTETTSKEQYEPKLVSGSSYAF